MSDYAPQHERINVITHFIGFVFGIIALPILAFSLYKSDDFSSIDVIGSVVYGIGFLMVFGFSTAYHFVSRPELKAKMKVWDHISIYYLIAGSYTPLLLAYADRADAFLMLSIVWGLALVGTIFKLFFTGRFRVVSTLIYLAMGWLVLFSPQSFKDGLPDLQLKWIATGGAFYSLGVIFYLVKKIPFHHAIWHVFVLCGAIAHFTGIWKMVL